VRQGTVDALYLRDLRILLGRLTMEQLLDSALEPHSRSTQVRALKELGLRMDGASAGFARTTCEHLVVAGKRACVRAQGVRTEGNPLLECLRGAWACVVLPHLADERVAGTWDGFLAELAATDPDLHQVLRDEMERARQQRCIDLPAAAGAPELREAPEPGSSPPRDATDQHPVIAALLVIGGVLVAVVVVALLVVVILWFLNNFA
jgi:hypothetical protein